MSLYIASLNSGSNGNAYYVGNENEAVLIDAGISCREIEKRMKQLGLPVKNLQAVFVSHEHGDHIKGVTTLANRHSLPVYITAKTAAGGPHLIRHLSRPFTHGEAVTVGKLSVIPFSKKHDAADPHSFMVSYQSVNVGIFTDIGIACDNVVHYFRQCHAAFLEANYDEGMLEQGRYPLHLKNRIRGGHGHLSNRQALDLFIQHRPPALSHLLLSHLSKENNDPLLVENLFSTHAQDTKIIVASRYKASEVYYITADGSEGKKTAVKQMGLFDG